MYLYGLTGSRLSCPHAGVTDTSRWLPSPPGFDLKKKNRIPRFLGGCCLGARWLCWLFSCFASVVWFYILSLPKVASHGDDVGDDSWLKWHSTLLTVLRHSWICRRHRIG